MERILRKRKLSLIDYLFDGKQSMEHLIDKLTCLKEQFEKEGYLHIATQREYFGYDEANEISLIGYSYETDEELVRRKESEKISGK